MNPPRPDYICCIARTHVGAKGASWCTRPNDLSFRFVDVDHAAEAGLNGSRLIACPDCVAAVLFALRHGG